MSCWPLIIVKAVVEDLRLEQLFKISTFLDHLDEVVLEEVGEDV
jgi:hypothetical protein